MQLYEEPVGLYYTFGENVGKMRATGWELSINWEDRKGDFDYGIGV